jgi:hypothetical protein
LPSVFSRSMLVWRTESVLCALNMRSASSSRHACQHTSAYVSIRQHSSACFSIRQHTSAYVSIRQHTSAYVSMRQHTSAYANSSRHACIH